MVVVDEQILRLEVPVDDVEFMQIFDAADDLMEYLAGLGLRYPMMGGCVLFGFDDVVEELPALHVLHDEEELLGGFDYLVELDDAGVPYELEYVNFSGDSFHVSHIHYLILLEDFHCHLFACQYVRGCFDFAERAFAQCFTYV